MEQNAQWIWYPGDFEVFHSLRVNCRREEHGYFWPAYWRLDDCYHSVQFRKTVTLRAPETFYVESNGRGFVSVDQQKHKLRSKIRLEKGTHTVEITVAKPDGLPCAFVSGETVRSDSSWEASCFNNKWLPAGSGKKYDAIEPSPETFPFSYQKIEPVQKTIKNGGTLYDFGRETFAELYFQFDHSAQENIPIFYGESMEEALDTNFSYIQDQIPAGVPAYLMKPRAFRYLFILDRGNPCTVTGRAQFLPENQKGKFHCSDPTLNRIWEVAAYTFHLCSREFFLDGIKRDRWIWSGDAFQSELTDFYLFFDSAICKRTILALRGKDPVEQHINTIVDYSFLWILSITSYYRYTGDMDFVRFVFPKMETLMQFCMERTDPDGFVDAREGDWVFIDWADFDRSGVLCAEQMLYAESLRVMSVCCGLVGKDSTGYLRRRKALVAKIENRFWREELGGYVDCYTSGENHITRQTNLFALWLGFGNEARREAIVRKVLLNPNVPAITTPYFQFYELDALCRLGRYSDVVRRIRNYWGGMLNLGATTFWEEYDPSKVGSQHYAMYGEKYGKSLCHAWGASPIYLIGKYFLGVRPTSAGYRTFEIRPALGGLEQIEGTVPLPGGQISVKLNKNALAVQSTKEGGKVIVGSKRIALPKDRQMVIPLKDENVI